MPRWALLSATAAPIVLLVTALVADELASAGYNPLQQTISVLAAAGRTEWLMTAGIAVSAGCLIIVGLGLSMVRKVARVVLIAGGAFGVLVAAFPVTMTTTLHLSATFASAFLLALWPALALSRSKSAPWALKTPVTIAGSLMLFALLGWTAYETQGGTLLGLAERITVVTELAWPAVVVATARFHRSRDRQRGQSMTDVSSVSAPTLR